MGCKPWDNPSSGVTKKLASFGHYARDHICPSFPAGAMVLWTDANGRWDLAHALNVAKPVHNPACIGVHTTFYPCAFRKLSQNRR